jgi:hypothetical protein
MGDVVTTDGSATLAAAWGDASRYDTMGYVTDRCEVDVYDAGGASCPPIAIGKIGKFLLADAARAEATRSMEATT